MILFVNGFDLFYGGKEGIKYSMNQKIIMNQISLQNEESDMRLLSLFSKPKKYMFNHTSGDILIYHQIQKTASTAFNLHLVHNLNIKCNCTHSAILPVSCSCKNKLGFDWLYSRLSKQLCKVHASWHQLQQCIPDLEDIIYKRASKLGNLFRFFT